MVRCDPVRNDHAWNARCQRSFESVQGIFEDDSPSRLDGNKFSGGKEEIGRRFRVLDIIDAASADKVVHQSESVKVSFDPLARRAGGNDAGNARGVGFLEQGNDTWKRRELASAIESVAFPFFVKFAPLDRAADQEFEVLLRVKSAEVGSHALRVGFKIKIVTMCQKVFPPGFVDRDFGVQDKTVEVKDERFRHAVSSLLFLLFQNRSLFSGKIEKALSNPLGVPRMEGTDGKGREV